MKNVFRYIQIPALVICLYSCTKDNYAAPSSLLTGTLLYNTDTVHVERNSVPYQIYQDGFGKVGSINGNFTQDGGFSEALFNGVYKIIIPSGQGPFIWKQLPSGAPDTMVVTVSGNQSITFDVTPYYTIGNTHVTSAGGVVTATFKVDKIITDANAKDIESVSLYINKTQFVSENGDDNLATTDLAGSAITDPSNISLNVTIPTAKLPSQTYVYARVGVKIVGVEDRIFSPLQQVSF